MTTHRLLLYEEVKVQLSEMVREMRRKKKKKLGERRGLRSRWGCKGFSYSFQVICAAFVGKIGFINVLSINLLRNTCRCGYTKKFPNLISLYVIAR